MSISRRLLLRHLVILLLLTVSSSSSVPACTTAVISGKATADGRPILWKNRDTSNRHNELIILEDGKYRVLAVVNADSRQSVWMGVNDAGFCIENSLSKDLRIDEKTEGPGNGSFMKRALQTCQTVADFRRLLEETNQTGRSTAANFGVIDANGGAAIFEAGPNTFTMFDANDPQVAPKGYLVRTNFATTAREVSGNPAPEQLGDIYSSKRFLQACRRLDSFDEDGIALSEIIRNMTRDLSDLEGRPYAGSVNGEKSALPPMIPTDQTISRSSTVSAAIFHGVKPGEDPAFTTMYTILGDPKFSIAVPCWVGVSEVADPLTDEHGGEIGEISITLRSWSMNDDKDGVITTYLPGIWNDVWPVEDQILKTVTQATHRWRSDGVSPPEMTKLHAELAALALQAMQQELREMKQSALQLAAPAAPQFNTTRVAIYDHSDGSASGPKNLLKFLTLKSGFECRRVSPEEIRNGILVDFDTLIMPGGSGSKQSSMLEDSGCREIREFVNSGGGYVGICAGSYLASSHYDWSLGLINAKVWDRSHWARGQGVVTLGLTDSGQKMLGVSSPTVDVRYAQGPLLVPDNQPDLPGYQVLAQFETEVALKGAQTDAMVGTHAIIRSKYGRGRVICFSPHPEVEGGPNSLMSAGVRWASSAD